MKKQRFLSFVLCISVLMGCFITSQAAEVTKNDYTADELDSSEYDLRKYTKPFWEGHIVYNEVVFPIKNQKGEIEPFELMYDASEIVCVKSYNHSVTYTENVDYKLVDGNLVIIPTGRISLVDYTYIHRPTVPSGYSSSEIYPYYPRKDGTGYEYWLENAEFSTRCISVTYIHNDNWEAPVPESQEDNLPKTFEKLKNGEDLTIVVAGDSVSAGAHASGSLGISPNADPYPEMSEKALREKYSNDGIKLINSAIGGTMSYFEESKMNSTIIQYDPDLVFINFGMNDSSCDRVGIPKAEFKGNIALQIEYIQKKLPDCEILLISSLYGNRYTFPAERYEEHAQALHELAAEYDGVGVTDPQKIQKYLIEETGIDYVSFTADNMVHPGDFGMRLSAQCVIEALSFSDIAEYRQAVIDRLIAYAEENNNAASKEEQIAHCISDVEARISQLDDEWDISAVMDEAFDELDYIIKTCVVHEYEDTVVPPTCDADGYTRSQCVICGYSYDHSPVDNPGLEHIMDTGRVTTSATYKSAGVKTYSCAVCEHTVDEVIPVLSNPPILSEQGMVHVNNDHNYIDTTITPYTEGSGFVELDVCPLSIEKYNGIPYVGLWFSGYSITACYNFRNQRVEIINTNLPFSTGNVYASADYEWTSDGGEYEYNWKKFAAQIEGNTVRIYIDGELILEHRDPAFSAKNEVALVYTNGELYFDNFKVGKGNYDFASGTGGTILGFWNFNSQSNYNNFFSKVNQSYGTPSFRTPNAANVTTGHYMHTHSGALINTVENGCAECGYNEYQCSMCGEVYRSDYTDPLYEDGHTLINETVTVMPNAVKDGTRTYECETCGGTFTQIIPKGTFMGDDTIARGDVDGNGSLELNDYTLLNRFINGASAEINTSGADVNRDGSITLNDLTALARILNGATID